MALLWKVKLSGKTFALAPVFQILTSFIFQTTQKVGSADVFVFFITLTVEYILDKDECLAAPFCEDYKSAIIYWMMSLSGLAVAAQPTI